MGYDSKKTDLMIKYEKIALQEISLWYNHSTKQAWEWYTKPHPFIDYIPGWDVSPARTPRQLILDGEGELVIEYLSMVLDKNLFFNLYGGLE